MATEPSSSMPKKGRLFGIDYGTKRVGVAVSDLFQKLASPLHNYQRNGAQADEHFFRKLAEEYEAVGLIVGLPVHLSGDESEKSREARRFASWLSKVTRLPVAFQDERFTSAEAESMLLQAELTKKQRKARIDKLAAQLLLQAWLDAREQPQQPLESYHPAPRS
ncbi:MAG: Holliday junction resolvase RuvX [Planctomycetaceae bacterium]